MAKAKTPSSVLFVFASLILLVVIHIVVSWSQEQHGNLDLSRVAVTVSNKGYNSSSSNASLFSAPTRFSSAVSLLASSSKNGTAKNEGSSSSSSMFESLLEQIEGGGSDETETFVVQAANATEEDLLSRLFGIQENVQQPPQITIVVQLSGELCNHLSKLAHGIGLALWLEGNYQVKSKLVLRHQNHPKWKSTQNQLIQAFRFAKLLDFEGIANTEAFEAARQQQEASWGGKEVVEAIESGIGNTNLGAALQAENVEEALELFVNKTHGVAYNNSALEPMLYSNRLSFLDVFVDRYAAELRQAFVLDQATACKLRPDPIETVFHFRGFIQEMPGAGRSMGFTEMGPRQVARELLAHLQPGDKVAIVTRFQGAALEPYVDALKQRGLRVRVIAGQSGAQDFCFLTSAQRGMVGMSMSTFFVWAGILGNCSRVDVYSLDTPERRAAEYTLQVPSFLHYNWTHPLLKDRFVFSYHVPNETAVVPTTATSNASAEAASPAAVAPVPDPAPQTAASPPVAVAPIASNSSGHDAATLNPASPHHHTYESLLARFQPKATADIDIVLQLNGETCNHLGKFAHGMVLSLWLEEQFQKSTRILLRRQPNNKWISGRKQVQQAFPFTRGLNFEEAYTDDFTRKLNEQETWLGASLAGQLKRGLGNGEYMFHNVDWTLLEQTLTQVFAKPPPPPSGGAIRIPFLYADRIVTTDHFADKYYDELRILFQFDEEQCALKPEPDETVFHFRNFLAEMPYRGKVMGYAELGPNQTARDLFGHLQEGDKVAIITRFAPSAASPYVGALQRRGLQVRVISGQSGAQDLCFLKSAQRGMVGISMSTFFIWAGLLSDCQRVMSYSVDSDERRADVIKRGRPVFLYTNWTRPELQQRFFFSLHRPDPTVDKV